MSEQEPARITAFAETIRKTIRAPIAFNDREIFLTASIGLALSDPQTQLSDEIIKDAELAMYHSKRIGGDRIDVYKPAIERSSSRTIGWYRMVISSRSNARRNSDSSVNRSVLRARIAGLNSSMRSPPMRLA